MNQVTLLECRTTWLVFTRCWPGLGQLPDSPSSSHNSRLTKFKSFVDPRRPSRSWSVQVVQGSCVCLMSEYPQSLQKCLSKTVRPGLWFIFLLSFFLFIYVTIESWISYDWSHHDYILTGGGLDNHSTVRNVSSWNGNRFVTYLIPDIFLFIKSFH